MGALRGGVNTLRLPRKVEGLLHAMEAAIAGNAEDLDRWMQDGYPALLNSCVRWAQSGDLGERIAHRVTLVAFRWCSRHHPKIAAERAWIRRVAFLERLKVRREARLPGAALPSGLPGPTREPIEILLGEEGRDRVRHAIDALPAKYRTLLFLRYVRGATEAEVAAWARSRAGIGAREAHRLLQAGREMVAAALRGADLRRTWPRRQD